MSFCNNTADISEPAFCPCQFLSQNQTGKIPFLELDHSFISRRSQFTEVLLPISEKKWKKSLLPWQYPNIKMVFMVARIIHCEILCGSILKNPWLYTAPALTSYRFALLYNWHCIVQWKMLTRCALPIICNLVSRMCLCKSLIAFASILLENIIHLQIFFFIFVKLWGLECKKVLIQIQFTTFWVVQCGISRYITYLFNCFFYTQSSS